MKHTFNELQAKFPEHTLALAEEAYDPQYFVLRQLIIIDGVLSNVWWIEKDLASDEGSFMFKLDSRDELFNIIAEALQVELYCRQGMTKDEAWAKVYKTEF